MGALLNTCRLAILAPALSHIAFKFSLGEYFALYLLAFLQPRRCGIQQPSRGRVCIRPRHCNRHGRA
ncbi:hypothetical protein OAN307_c15010 [Octadecabacter antarcticus 307]|uniref:Uncharacterized protein n=1 Tax=Octadecabacter antarcticus 307 TaxID=391626 RepID=M9RBH4_9RHOB|nr:hypothetical protein OAN307_c15010 [Octadecabacter antarcticus 307]